MHAALFVKDEGQFIAACAMCKYCTQVSCYLHAGYSRELRDHGTMAEVGGCSSTTLHETFAVSGRARVRVLYSTEGRQTTIS
jgi:hypothetical protein